MSKIVVYVKPADPYSTRLLEFLRRKQLSFTKKVVSEDPDIYQEFVTVTGEVEPPILVINGEVIGDYERVTSLDLHGKLDDYLR